MHEQKDLDFQKWTLNISGLDIGAITIALFAAI